MYLQANTLQHHWLFLFICLSAFFGVSHGNCSEPPRLEFAILADEFLTQKDFATNANVTYNCIPGYIRVPGTSNNLTCLNTGSWSTPQTFCSKRSCGNPGEIANGNFHAEDFLFGSRVNYTCNEGYRMVSRYNYRDCLADGTWSNAPPICEVTICHPPPAIADGNFEPQQDEYQYLNAVTYSCSGNRFALLGEKTISCNASGLWSAEAPKCKAVECENPTVQNAIKQSGFNGPYYFQSAVTFECIPGYKMSGSSLVRCNESSQWDPPLPSCYRETVTTTPSKETTITKGSTFTVKTTTREDISTASKGTTVTVKTTAQKEISTESKDDGNGAAGAIAGKIVTLAMFIMGLVLSSQF